MVKGWLKKWPLLESRGHFLPFEMKEERANGIDVRYGLVL